MKVVFEKKAAFEQARGKLVEQGIAIPSDGVDLDKLERDLLAAEEDRDARLPLDLLLFTCAGIFLGLTVASFVELLLWLRR